jgi:hypothetical protein
MIDNRFLEDDNYGRGKNLINEKDIIFYIEQEDEYRRVWWDGEYWTHYEENAYHFPLTSIDAKAMIDMLRSNNVNDVKYSLVEEN